MRYWWFCSSIDGGLMVRNVPLSKIIEKSKIPISFPKPFSDNISSLYAMYISILTIIHCIYVYYQNNTSCSQYILRGRCGEGSSYPHTIEISSTIQTPAPRQNLICSALCEIILMVFTTCGTYQWKDINKRAVNDLLLMSSLRLRTQQTSYEYTRDFIWNQIRLYRLDPGRTSFSNNVHFTSNIHITSNE